MANTFTSLHYHVVFSTKRREPWLRPEIQDRVWAYLGGIARQNELIPLLVGGICGIERAGGPAQASLTRRDRCRSVSPWAEAARLPSSRRSAMSPGANPANPGDQRQKGPGPRPGHDTPAPGGGRISAPRSGVSMVAVRL